MPLHTDTGRNSVYGCSRLIRSESGKFNCSWSNDSTFLKCDGGTDFSKFRSVFCSIVRSIIVYFTFHPIGRDGKSFGVIFALYKWCPGE